MQAVADSIPQLVQGMRSSQAQPEELGAQLALIMASQSFLQVGPAAYVEVLLLCETRIKQLFFTTFQPGSKMVTSAKSAVPTVADQAAAMQLGQCAKNLATCLAELRTATQKVFDVLVMTSSSGSLMRLYTVKPIYILSALCNAQVCCVQNTCVKHLCFSEGP